MEKLINGFFSLKKTMEIRCVPIKLKKTKFDSKTREELEQEFKEIDKNQGDYMTQETWDKIKELFYSVLKRIER